MTTKKAIITDFNKVWEDEVMIKGIIPLENNLDFLAKGNGIDNKVYIEIYSVCYDLCVQKEPYNFAKELYAKHQIVMGNFLERKFLSKSITLEQFIDYYPLYLIMNKWLNNFMMYLNRFHIKVNNLPLLSDSGIEYFKKMVFSQLKIRLYEMINIKINNYRDGNTIDFYLIKNVLSIFDDIDKKIYLEEYIPSFLEGLQMYYRVKSAKLLAENSSDGMIDKYIKLVHENIDAEWLLIETNFRSLTKEKSLKILYDVFIKDNSENLLNAFEKYIRNDDYSNINMAYLLFLYIDDGKKLMSGRVTDIITSLCTEHLNAEPDILIESFIQIYDKFIVILDNPCNNDNAIALAIKCAFSNILNKENPKFKYEEIFAQYINKTLKTPDNPNIEAHLKKLIYLVNCFTSKDLFEEYYRILLSKRFLAQQIPNVDIEMFFIQQLKVAIGVTFTVKLTGIINDVVSCKEHSSEWENKISELGLIDNEVQVLTNTHWPSLIKPSVKLPEQLQKVVDNFNKFYVGKFSQRKLEFILSQGTVNVKAKLNKVTYEFILNTLQAVVLNAFNFKSSYVMFDLIEYTGIPGEMLAKILHSLYNEKVKILLKNENTFTINDKYVSKLRKVKIPMVSLEENKTNTNKLTEERSMLIDMALVRIMKTRKVLSFPNLLLEVQRQITFFKADTPSIKKRIESLIEREYLERDENDSTTFKYLA